MAEMSGKEIYDNFHNGGGPEGLAGGAAIVKSVSGRYRDRVREIQLLVSEMESAWQGGAAGQAQRGAAPLLTEHEIASHHFSVAEDLTDRQSGSFSRAKNSVMPMPPEPGPVPPLGPLSPDWVPYEQNIQRNLDSAQHNVDIMNTYSGASRFNTDNLPTKFGELADDQAGVTFDQPDTIDSEDFRDTGTKSGGPDSGSVSGSRDFGPGPVSGDSGPATRPNVNTPPPVPGQVAPAGSTVPGGFSPVSGQPPFGTPLPTTDPGPGRPVPTGGGPVAGFGPIGGGTGFGPGGSRGGPGEFGPRGGGSTGGGMPPRGGGSAGGGMPPRGGGPAGGGMPRGGIAGVGAEPGPARPGSTFGPAGARGAGAGMGGMPMGGGRGRGEDDTERKAPTYLEGGDPESLFGNELLTAPAVIGEDEYEDD